MKKETLSAVGLLLLRVVVGFGLATHGYQKLFGGHMDQFASGVRSMGFPLPTVFAWIAALSELLGGILIALGLKTRIAAAFAFVTMAVAVFIHHAADPFHVKELALLYLSGAGSVMMIGAGKFSLDRT
jgi:putative oxidoreductase